MAVHASIRIQMADRPGALSAIGAALAANGVDIVRLDVVSHEGASVIDDLYLAAATTADIERACRSFFGEVVVQRLMEGSGGDPATEMGASLARVASAPDLDSARSAAITGALPFLHAETAVLLASSADGALTGAAPASGFPDIAADEAFAARWALANRKAVAFPAAPGWAPEAFHAALGSAWVAAAPCGRAGLLLVGRAPDVAFYAGELERLSVYADAVGAILALLGDAAEAPLLAPISIAELPPRAVVGGRPVAAGA